MRGGPNRDDTDSGGGIVSGCCNTIPSSHNAAGNLAKFGLRGSAGNRVSQESRKDSEERSVASREVERSSKHRSPSARAGSQTDPTCLRSCPWEKRVRAYEILDL